jgi:release factor glutamine methyltransferase
VPAGDRHLDALQFEPRGALVGGDDGLHAIREITRGAAAHLNPGGWLLLEHGMGQQAAVAQLLADGGLESLTSWPDLARIPRIAGGKVK